MVLLVPQQLDAVLCRQFDCDRGSTQSLASHIGRRFEQQRLRHLVHRRVRSASEQTLDLIEAAEHLQLRMVASAPADALAPHQRQHTAGQHGGQTELANERP